MKRLYFDFLEWLLFKIEERIYLEEDRREQLEAKINELNSEIRDLNEMLDDYRYAEYMEEMRDSTWRY